MDKELKAWEIIKNNYLLHNSLIGNEVEIVETALKEHQNDKQIWENYLKEIKNLPNVEIQIKLKALEIIKEIVLIEEEDFFYDKETDTYFFIGYKVSKERYDLLKKVLL